jgi:DNA-binding MarR family transcriptional regulator
MERTEIIENFRKVVDLKRFKTHPDFPEIKALAPLINVLLDMQAENEKWNLSEIAKRLGISKAAVSKKICILMRKKLITRYFEPNDRKNAYLRLTKQTELMFEKWEEQFVIMINKIIEELGEKETVEFLTLLQKVQGIIDSIQEENLNVKIN